MSVIMRAEKKMKEQERIYHRHTIMIIMNIEHYLYRVILLKYIYILCLGASEREMSNHPKVNK